MRTIIFSGCVLVVVLSPILGAVAPSPFLPPGYNSRPRAIPAQNNTLKPKPQTGNVQIAKEIEFCGYFSLGSRTDRKLFFSLFNKKVNHGQWVTIGEKTDEDFLAETFDFENETLTVRFGDSSHDLSLRESKGSPSPSVKPGTSTPSRVPAATAAHSPGKPRVMPPRPKTTPTLPPWLANRVASGTSRTGGGIRGASSGRSAGGVIPAGSPSTRFPLGYVPRRVGSPSSPVSPTPTTGVGSVTSNPISSNPFPQTVPSSGGSFSPAVPVTGGGASSSSVGGTTSVTPPESGGGTVSSGTIDLNDLPPPPPPPDILPPGPPPNIVPSREE